MQELRGVLDELAHLVANLSDDATGRHLLAPIVADLERLADAELHGLGQDADDILPVLFRRFARAQRRLLEAEDLPADAGARLARHAAVLRDPFCTLLDVWAKSLRQQPRGRTLASARA